MVYSLGPSGSYLTHRRRFHRCCSRLSSTRSSLHRSLCRVCAPCSFGCPCSCECLARHDAVSHGPEKSNDLLADFIKPGRWCDKNVAAPQVGLPALLDQFILIEGTCECVRTLRCPRRSSAIKAALNRGAKSRAIEGEGSGECVNVVKVFHTAVSPTELHHRLELLRYGCFAWISPNARSRKVRQHRRVFDLANVGREGIAYADIYLHPDSCGTQKRPKQ